MEDFDGFFAAMEAEKKAELWKRRKDFLCMVHKPGNGFKRSLVKQRLEQQSISTDKQTSSINILAVLMFVLFAGLTTAISSAVPVILSTSKEYSQKDSSDMQHSQALALPILSALQMLTTTFQQECQLVTLFAQDRSAGTIKIFDPGGER
jgi:hypothetical protein